MDMHSDRPRWDRAIDLTNLYTKTANDLGWLVTEEITWEQEFRESKPGRVKIWEVGSAVCCWRAGRLGWRRLAQLVLSCALRQVVRHPSEYSIFFFRHSLFSALPRSAGYVLAGADILWGLLYAERRLSWRPRLGQPQQAADVLWEWCQQRPYTLLHFPQHLYTPPLPSPAVRWKELVEEQQNQRQILPQTEMLPSKFAQESSCID